MNTRPCDLDQAQRGIHSALNYFLYSSLAQSNRPLFFQRTLDGTLLRNAEMMLGVNGRCASPDTQDWVSPREFAERLAGAYAKWGRVIPQGDACERVPEGKPYSDWHKQGGSHSRFKPVHFLQSFLHGSAGDLFLRALVHGSVATLDDELGFSDLDLAFVIKSDVLCDPTSLQELRSVAAVLLATTFAFDPHMHHGPFFLTEFDLNWYPQSFLPMVVLSYGVELFDSSRLARLDYYERDSARLTGSMIRQIRDGFESLSKQPFRLNNSFEIESYLGTTMILPALFLHQKNSTHHYKRDTFNLAREYFSQEDWEPIAKATLVRTSLPPRTAPKWTSFQLARFSKCPYIVARKGMKQTSNKSRGHIASGIIGNEFPAEVLRLIDKMLDLDKDASL